MSRIDIAKEFKVVVRKIGGMVLDDGPRAPNSPEIADYWFPAFDCIAELKLLSKDLREKEDFRGRLRLLHEKWVREGRVPSSRERIVRIRTGELPESCAREFVELIKSRLESSTIRKANKQIKATRSLLGRPDAAGLLLLANDGNLILKPDAMAHLLARILKGKHRSISSVVYFSANQRVRMPGMAVTPLFWIDGVLKERRPAPKALRERLQEAWFAHHSTLVEGPVIEFRGNADPNVFEQIDFEQ
ncbi:MAG: hypothetical protein ABIH26_08225 [Candidatus Eisenbacteria bacterium]